MPNATKLTPELFPPYGRMVAEWEVDIFLAHRGSQPAKRGSVAAL
jgi:hypothetical protein